MTKRREEGYYWVKPFSPSHAWELAHYWYGEWRIGGEWFGAADPAVIGPRIEPPPEGYGQS